VVALIIATRKAGLRTKASAVYAIGAGVFAVLAVLNVAA
jgi:hypothetical protein